MKLWWPPLAFTVFIFATLNVVSGWWKTVFDVLGSEKLKLGFLFVLGMAFLLWVVKIGTDKKSHKLSRLVWLIVIVGIYIYFLSIISNVVEQIHLAEYGILTWLYFRPINKRINNVAAYILTWLLVGVIGILDEWVQFYLPSRVGVLPDIYLNLSSSALALILIAKTIRPKLCPLDRSGLRLLGAGVGMGSIILAAFILTVSDFGFLHKDDETGNFYSHYSIEELIYKNQNLTDSYVQSVKELYPVKMHSYLKNQRTLDKYKMEVLVHVFRRDRYKEKGKLLVAYKENLILEKYFPGILHLAGFKWPENKVKKIASELPKAEGHFYESPVSRDDVLVTFSPASFWIFTVIVVVFSFLVGWIPNHVLSFIKTNQ